jgi:hypothetical protein
MQQIPLFGAAYSFGFRDPSATIKHSHFPHRDAEIVETLTHFFHFQRFET